MAFAVLLNDMDDLNEHWDNVAHYFLMTNSTVSKEATAEISRKIKEYYFGKKKVSKEHVGILVKVL